MFAVMFFMIFIGMPIIQIIVDTWHAHKKGYTLEYDDAPPGY